MIIIGVLLYKRPEYTKRMFSAIAKLKGLENCRIICNIDPGFEEVTAQAMNWTLTPIDILVNNKNLGCNKNMLSLCDRCFSADADAVTIIEDDVEISSDWLQFCSNPEFKRLNIDAITAYRKHTEVPELNLSDYTLGNTWGTWGWYSWKDKYYKWRWVFEENPDNALSWDTALCRHYFHKQNQATIVTPVLGRSFNFGKKDGTYCFSEAEYYRANWTRYYYNGTQIIETD